MAYRRFLSPVILFACCLWLIGCEAISSLEPAPQFAVEQGEDVLPPYYLQIGDVLALKLLLNPELEEDVVIRPDGKISTTVVQNIMAYGKTPEALQAELNEHYAQHLSEPDVAIIVRSFAPSKFYILGEVNSPGEYLSTDHSLTLLQALSMAGNVKNSANTESILIVRRAGTAEARTYVTNYDDATSGLVPGADIMLAASDVVFVPRTAIADIYVQYEQTIQQFVTPNVGVSYRLGQ